MDVRSSDAKPVFSLPEFKNSDSTFNENVGYVRNSTFVVASSETNHGRNDVALRNHSEWNENPENILKKDLKWAFFFHAYGFGCIFFILAIYSFFSILNLRSYISNRPYMSTINGFLCLLGTSRAISLFVDPYNLKESMPKLIRQVLWDLGFPSIISAFCLVQLAFLHLTQLRFGPEGLRRKSCLSLTITAHFLLTIGIDIIVASNESVTIVKAIIQYIFITWGVFLCSNFLYSGYKIMSIIRNIPAGLKQRPLLDQPYKGILQLPLPVPQQNLTRSMTTAFIPNSCSQKIHHQDYMGLSAIGFRNDGNTRILESESIPMLEEIAASSGDETSQKTLVRGPSFQNQTRSSQKFLLKPKVSLKSVDDVADEDMIEKNEQILKKLNSTIERNESSKFLSVRATSFDSNLKQSHKMLSQTENTGSPRNSIEFKSEINRCTSFENETFYFKKNKQICAEENKSDNKGNLSLIIASFENLSNNVDNMKEKKNSSIQTPQTPINAKNSKTEETKIVLNEIKNDPEDVEVLKNDGRRNSDTSDVHTLKSEKHRPAVEDGFKNKIQSSQGLSDNEESNERKSGRTSEITNEECNNLSATIEGMSKFEGNSNFSSKSGKRKGSKSLTWKLKNSSNENEENATQECLLSHENSAEVSIKAMLNGIKNVSKTESNESCFEKDQRLRLERILNITYVTAMWGLMLCLSNVGRLYGPSDASKLRDSPIPRTMPKSSEKDIFSLWPWLWFQTFCRALELAMGCAMANITRRPAANQKRSRAFN